jgi:hypothetical protein
MEASEEIRLRGWTQGAVIAAKFARALTFRHLPIVEDDAVMVVISQSCDIVQSSIEREPWIEILKARPAQEPNGNYAHGKNPRSIQFGIDGVIYEASCHDRAIFPREELAKIEPDKRQLTQHTIGMLAEWIAKRYVRPAFPDELNRRIYAQRTKIGDVLKKHGALISQILLHHTPADELPVDEGDYALVVKLVVPDDDYADKVKKEAALKATIPLEKALNACSGIKVANCSLASESTITLDDLRWAAPWDFDYLTHRMQS